MSIGFGSLARIGHLYPSGGLCDYEVQVMAPDGVQFLTTRLPFSRTGVEHDAALLNELERHCALLADAAVDLIAVNCTAATMMIGADVVNARVQAATGIASVTTIEAVMAALEAAGVFRPALLTPYPAEVVAMERDFFAAAGIEIAAEGGQRCDTPVQQGNIPPQRWAELARDLAASDADGLLLSCAGIQIAAVLERIEAEFGRPVITSNSALLWQVLRMAGISDRPIGYGALLAGTFDQLEIR